jgi:TIR domain
VRDDLREGVRYHVAISYASEDSAFARTLADYLRGRGLEIFFAEFSPERLLGEDLQLEFQKIFMTEAERAVIVVSKNYVNKVWPLTEFAAVRAAILVRQQQNYLIPIRLDDSTLPGLLPQIGYADGSVVTAAEIGATIIAKAWPELRLQKAYEIASPRSASEHGHVTFNYRDYGGRYRLGSGQAEFETHWTTAGPTSIHCYANQTKSITAIALVPKNTSLRAIDDAAALPARNPSETVYVGRSVALRNNHGFYAGLTILNVKSEEHGDITDELTIEYVILKNGGRDFRKAAFPERSSDAAPRNIDNAGGHIRDVGIHDEHFESFARERADFDVFE